MWKFLVNKIVALRRNISSELDGTDVEKPFIEHLEDLRKMIVRSAITILITTMACFVFEKELLAIMQHPLTLASLNSTLQLSAIEQGESFNMSVRVAFTAAVVIAFPIVMFFVLQFILPGLRHTEKRILWPSMAVGVGLFLLGACFGYFAIVPQMLQFFHSWDVSHNLSSEWRLSSHIKMVSNFVLLTGLAFELPVLIMAFVKLEILSFRVMNKNRGVAAIIIFAAAAVITPTTDAVALMMLAAPMYLLFEVCIWLAWFMERRDRKLHPDMYKDFEDIEVRDDWDTEEYNPWQEIDRAEGNRSGEPPMDEYQRRAAEAAKAETETPVDDATANPLKTSSHSPTDTGSDVAAAIRREADAADTVRQNKEVISDEPTSPSDEPQPSVTPKLE